MSEWMSHGNQNVPGESMHATGSDTIFIQIYMDTLSGVPGVLGVSKNQIFVTNKTVEFLPQKGANFEKSSKSKNSCFLRVFQIFFNLGAILVHQTSNDVFSGPWCIFWHPRDPWGQIHIEYIKVLVFVFDISEWWRPLQLFSTNSK